MKISRIFKTIFLIDFITGLLKAIKECIFSYFSSILKFLFYLIIQNHFKKKIYLNSASGFYNALLGKPSCYRPNLND